MSRSEASTPATSTQSAPSGRDVGSTEVANTRELTADQRRASIILMERELMMRLYVSGHFTQEIKEPVAGKSEAP